MRVLLALYISWFIPITIPNAIYNEEMIMITGFGMLCKYIVINRNCMYTCPKHYQLDNSMEKKFPTTNNYA